MSTFEYNQRRVTIKIVNLTQHIATADQVKAGVVEPTAEQKAVIVSALNFSEIPNVHDMKIKSDELASIMSQYDPDLSGDVKFMIGGAPYLMAALVDWAPVYEMVFAFSERISEEQHMPDGSVRKVNVFKHQGFIPMMCCTNI